MGLSTVLVSILLSVVTALATAFFTSRFYVYRVKADLQKEYESRFNERKWEVYTKFVEFLRLAVQPFSSESEELENSRKADEFVSSLWLIGSDEVIKAFNEWHKAASLNLEQRRPPDKLWTKMVRVLIEMRKDLGSTSSKIDPKDLYALFAWLIPENADYILSEIQQ